MLCESKNIILYRIRERACWFWQETAYLKLIPCSAKDFSDLNNAILLLLMELNCNIFTDVDVLRDEMSIREQFTTRIETESLYTLYPELAKEWHPTKNGNLTPKMVTKKSTANVWWIDSHGHEWQAKVHSRTRGSGCPYCCQPAKKLLSGFNDLATRNPELATEWDFHKNSTSPSNVLSGSAKKFWWICPMCKKNYLASPANRIHGTGCPECGKENSRKAKFKKVRNLDTGEIFESMKDACIKYNLKSGNLGKCCNGKRKTCGGYRWEFV